MRTDEAVKRQLSNRLKRLRLRAKEVAAEIVMVERLLADVEQHSQGRMFRLRKNSVAKWSIQAQVTSLLEKAACPLRAQYLLEIAKQTNPSLKPSTFRSHLKRMADAGVLKRSGGRGRYELAQKVPDEPKEVDHRKPKRIFFQD